MKTSKSPLWAQPRFQEIAGTAWRPGGVELTRHGLALCALAPGSRVLDVGCGAGATLALLEEQGNSAVGLDTNVAAITATAVPQADNAAERSASPALVCADATHMPFADASFDGLCMECVLSLMPEPEGVVRQCARVLRHGGRMLLTDLYAHHARPQGNGQSCHERALPRTLLETLFVRAGLVLMTFEDHTLLLRKLAARLVWYGQANRSDFCACGTGYGLWLLQKGELA